MSSANERAEAILIVIKKLFKWLAIGLLIFIGVILSFIFFASKYEDYQTAKKKKIEDKISIKAFHPKEGPCDKDYPYQYEIFNNSGKVVEKVEFNVSIKRIGFSNELNGYTKIEEDKIIPNGEGWGRCFRASANGDYRRNLTDGDVEIEIKYKEITFKD